MIFTHQLYVKTDGIPINRQCTRQRQVSTECRHGAISSLASDRPFSTLLNTLNCIKSQNFGQDLCHATTEVDLEPIRK